METEAEAAARTQDEIEAGVVMIETGIETIIKATTREEQEETEAGTEVQKTDINLDEVDTD